jgi:hypothetical protein
MKPAVSMKKALLMLSFSLVLFSACDLYTYGTLGGMDQTSASFPTKTNSPVDSPFYNTLDLMTEPSGIWYSHYAGIGRLDSYRIMKWKDFLTDQKTRDRAALLFKDFDPATVKTYGTQTAAQNDDYVVLYDDTVYGQEDDEDSLQASWGHGFMAVVRAVNIFNGDEKRGALIVEYLEHCAAYYLETGTGGGALPYYGIYFRVLDPDCIQMANPVNWDAIYNGGNYHTETATLEEAIEKNGVDNEAEFINWGMTIPQDREM